MRQATAILRRVDHDTVISHGGLTFPSSFINEYGLRRAVCKAEEERDLALSLFRNISVIPAVPHIHEKIDFTVAIFVVQQGKVLLVHHRKLNKWLPLGGHIELDEDPEQAALREAREERGFEVELVGERPPTTEAGTRALIAPRFLDIHRITDTHEHIGMIYWARPKSGALELAAAEHHHIRWCGKEELATSEPRMSNAVQWYCRQAIDELGE